MLSNLRTSYTVLLGRYFLHQNTQGKAHDLQKLMAKLLFIKQILPQIKNQGLLVKVPKSRQSTLILCHLTYTFSAEIYFQLFVTIITIPRPILLISSSTSSPVPLLKQSDTWVLSSLLLYHQQHIYTTAKPLPTNSTQHDCCTYYFGQDAGRQATAQLLDADTTMHQPES